MSKLTKIGKSRISMTEKNLEFNIDNSKKHITDVYQFNINAFTDSVDAWTKDSITKQIKDGWSLYSVNYDGDILAAGFIKEDENALLTKNTPIKMEYQGNGFSHMIKDYYEEYAKNKSIPTIYNYCPFDSFRLISLNERHGYDKTGKSYGKNGEIVEWMKKIS